MRTSVLWSRWGALLGTAVTGPEVAPWGRGGPCQAAEGRAGSGVVLASRGIGPTTDSCLHLHGWAVLLSHAQGSGGGGEKLGRETLICIWGFAW